VYRHQLRFVLRFGVRGQFTELIHKLNVGETARGWATPRVWQAITGLVNEIVIEHDYDSVGAFGIERTAFHRDPGEAAGCRALGSHRRIGAGGASLRGPRAAFSEWK
jgi:hypothetical protein